MRRFSLAWLAAGLFLALILGPPTSGLAQRPTEVAGTEAAIVAGHPLAAAAGADVLRRGGNAVDAAIAAAAVLAVVRPHMNGIGGDNFMLIHEAATGRVHALNGSGRAGSHATPAGFRERGQNRVPSSGIFAANTVPGAARGWHDAHQRFGSRPFSELLQPAIRYARDGYPVSTKLAADLSGGRGTISRDPALSAVLMRGGRTPRAGELLRNPDLANTLEAVAARGADGFYRGEVAQRIASFMEQERGFVTLEDLANHTSTWQEPLETTYAGIRVLATPPNSQGIALPMQLNLAERFDLREMGHNSADYLHVLSEVKRVAFADRDRYISDPERVEIPVERLMSKEYARERAEQIRFPGSLLSLPATDPPFEGDGDTIFVQVVDKDGNAISLIQSLFNSLGSGRMVPGTGVLLQNRGSSFTLNATHANVVAPGKRPYHTLFAPMLLREDGSFLATLGTPGGDGQTQTITQVINNLFLFNMSPQEAVEAPRYRSQASGRLDLEPGVDDDVVAELRRRGLNISTSSQRGSAYGGAQVILSLENGILRTGADPRREAHAIAW